MIKKLEGENNPIIYAKSFYIFFFTFNKFYFYDCLLISFDWLYIRGKSITISIYKYISFVKHTHITVDSVMIHIGSCIINKYIVFARYHA